LRFRAGPHNPPQASSADRNPPVSPLCTIRPDLEQIGLSVCRAVYLCARAKPREGTYGAAGVRPVGRYLGLKAGFVVNSSDELIGRGSPSAPRPMLSVN